MADCEDFQGSHTVLGKRKGKKSSRKDHQDEVTRNKDDIWKKKKKKGSKCKDPPGTKKEKKKDKKKKKRKIPVGPDSGLVFTDVRPPAAVHRTQSPRQDQEPKPKRRKKVAFDLPPGNVPAKRPQFAWSTAAAFEGKTPGDTARPAQDDNSPCNSEEVNSQDLFITQKTFRAPSPEPCGGDAVAAAPAQSTGRGGGREPEGSARGGGGRRRAWKSPKTEPFPEETLEAGKTIKTEEESSGCPQVKAKLPGASPERQRVRARPRADRLPAQAAAADAPRSWTSSRHISTSTQTENFFTMELSSYLRFTRSLSARSADLDPLDLSLPQRARKGPGGSLSGDRIKGSGSRTNPSCCSESGCKSADSTASSGEEQSSRTKLDLTQVRAVQTRLNESFFFKTKGDGQSPRPASPLMKLIQGGDGRSRK